MEKTINLKEVYDHAGELYRKGDFYCSESIVATMREYFDKDMPEALISSASGFPIGVGRQKCMCGAITGGIISIGYFFGRTEGADPQVNKTLELSAELHEKFKEMNKYACCSILTRGMDFASGEHKEQCIRFTSEMARETAIILARELNLEVVEG